MSSPRVMCSGTPLYSSCLFWECTNMVISSSRIRRIRTGISQFSSFLLSSFLLEERVCHGYLSTIHLGRTVAAFQLFDDSVCSNSTSISDHLDGNTTEALYGKIVKHDHQEVTFLEHNQSTTADVSSPGTATADGQADHENQEAIITSPKHENSTTPTDNKRSPGTAAQEPPRCSTAMADGRAGHENMQSETSPEHEASTTTQSPSATTSTEESSAATADGHMIVRDRQVTFWEDGSYSKVENPSPVTAAGEPFQANTAEGPSKKSTATADGQMIDCDRQVMFWKNGSYSSKLEKPSLMTHIDTHRHRHTHRRRHTHRHMLR